MNTIKSILLTLLIVSTLIFTACQTKQPTTNEQSTETELNIVSWIGYDEEEFIKPFEDKYGVKVNVKTAVGDPNVVSLLEQSPDMYDLIIIGPESVPKLQAKGLLEPIDSSKYPVDNFIEPFNDFPFITIENKTCAVLIRWGSNGLLYNTNYLTKKDVSSYSILWDKKVTGKVGIWDFYIPSMGVISKYLGNEQAHNISDEKLAELAETLYSLKPQVKSILASGADVHTALANEEVWIVPGGGEWNAAILQSQGYPIDWTIPKEGGLMWAESISIVKGAKHPDLADKFIKYISSPEGQALVSWREAYIGIPVNKGAFALLSREQQDIIHAHNAEEAQALATQVTVRSLPVQQEEEKWLEIWQTFKAK